MSDNKILEGWEGDTNGDYGMLEIEVELLLFVLWLNH